MDAPASNRKERSHGYRYPRRRRRDPAAHQPRPDVGEPRLVQDLRLRRRRLRGLAGQPRPARLHGGPGDRAGGDRRPPHPRRLLCPLRFHRAAAGAGGRDLGPPAQRHDLQQRQRRLGISGVPDRRLGGAGPDRRRRAGAQVASAALRRPASRPELMEVPVSKLTLVSHELCPFVQRAAIALAEKGIAFERVTIDLANKPDWFLAISPLGKVPLLKVGDAVIFESSVIVEYLEETQPNPLHPSDPLTRADHRAWMEFGSSILMDLWGFYTATDEATLQGKATLIAGKFERLEQRLGEGPYFDGARFSLVDAVFAPVYRYFDT